MFVTPCCKRQGVQTRELPFVPQRAATPAAVSSSSSKKEGRGRLKGAQPRPSRFQYRRALFALLEIADEYDFMLGGPKIKGLRANAR